MYKLCNHVQLQGYVYEMERKKVPLVFFFCKPDIFISSKMNFDHAAMYGIMDKNTDVYTADGQLTQKGADFIIELVLTCPATECALFKRGVIMNA